MPHPAVVILGYSEAAMFLRGSPPPRVSAVVSIRGRREFGVDAAVPHRLDLAFDDVDLPIPGDPVSVLRTASRRRWAADNGLTETAPTPADVAAIIAFTEATRNADGIALFHCGAGMSRAPAAALVALAVWRGPGAEAGCVAEVLRLRRGATPHAGIVRLADEALGRGGRLVEALAAASVAGR